MQLLAGIRQAMGVTQAAMAARLATTPAIVADLESGAFDVLPAWPETRRIVDMWVAGAGLDPRPALASLALALEPRDALAALPVTSQRGNRESPGSTRQPPYRPSFGAGTGGPDRSSEHEGSSRSRALGAVSNALQRAFARLSIKNRPPTARPRSLIKLSVGLPPSRAARWATLVVVTGVLATTAAQTKVFASAFSKLPAPAELAVRSISDFFAVRFAPVREGHRWIEVDDPRSRRGDKLRIGRHSD